MTDIETKVVNIIRGSKDPAKAMDRAIDILARMENGEGIESIAASYGVKWEGVK